MTLKIGDHVRDVWENGYVLGEGIIRDFHLKLARPTALIEWTWVNPDRESMKTATWIFTDLLHLI